MKTTTYLGTVRNVKQNMVVMWNPTKLCFNFLVMVALAYGFMTNKGQDSCMQNMWLVPNNHLALLMTLHLKSTFKMPIIHNIGGFPEITQELIALKFFVTWDRI